MKLFSTAAGFQMLCRGFDCVFDMSDPRGIVEGMNEDVEQLFTTLKQTLDRVDALVMATPVGVLGDATAQDRLTDLMMHAMSGFHQHETLVSRIAGKIAPHCHPDLGIRGLGSRYGIKTPAALIADLCKTSYSEAARLVQNGILLETTSNSKLISTSSPADAEERSINDLTRVPIAQALQDGLLSPAQANEIGKALDKTKTLLSVEEQTVLATTLVTVGEDLPVNSLKSYAEKKILSVTTETPLERELRIREKRYLTIGRMEDGLYPLRGLLDPESAALVKAVFDDASNPNRVSVTEEGSSIEHQSQSTGRNHTKDSLGSPVLDTRTTGQKHLDRLIELLNAGIGVNPNQTYTGNKPAVKVITSIEDLSNTTGEAWFEGIEVPVSSQTAQRIRCTNGTQKVVTDQSGIPLYLGRNERIFTPAQKQALTIRDGGCLWPGCDRPPSWCEAHHIQEWEKGGHTNLDNGILLCRHHHMHLHHYDWRIEPVSEPEGFRQRSSKDPSAQSPLVLFMLHPPPSDPMHQSAIPMPSKAAWHSKQTLQPEHANRG